MRPQESWRRVVALQHVELRGSWEDGLSEKLRTRLDRWKWASLRELADVLDATPFEVLEKCLTPGDRIVMVTPFPEPHPRLVGWVKVLLRPNLMTPIAQVPQSYLFWDRRWLGREIVYQVDMGFPVQACASLQYFLDKLHDEHPVMVPRRWADAALRLETLRT